MNNPTTTGDYLFAIDQAEALRRGHVVNSTAIIRVDLATLDQRTRDLFATHLSRGFHLTGLPLRIVYPTPEALATAIEEHWSAKERATNRRTETMPLEKP